MTKAASASLSTITLCPGPLKRSGPVKRRLPALSFSTSSTSSFRARRAPSRGPRTRPTRGPPLALSDLPQERPSSGDLLADAVGVGRRVLGLPFGFADQFRRVAERPVAGPQMKCPRLCLTRSACGENPPDGCTTSSDNGNLPRAQRETTDLTSGRVVHGCSASFHFSGPSRSHAFAGSGANGSNPTMCSRAGTASDVRVRWS